MRPTSELLRFKPVATAPPALRPTLTPSGTAAPTGTVVTAPGILPLLASVANSSTFCW